MAFIGIIKRNLLFIFNFINLGFIQASNALIQILLIPIILRAIGIAEFGFVMIASSYAALVSLFINYGSNQSGIKDVTLYQSNTKKLSETFFSIYLIRIILFAVSFLGVLVFSFFVSGNIRYFILANAIILSETLNPFFFFVGVQKLFLYNIVNLVAKMLSAMLVIFLVTSSTESEWVNFYLGITGTAGNLALCIYIVKKYQLCHYKISLSSLGQYLKQNFYLTGNSMFVQMQQSIFLFAVSKTGSQMVLGAYSLCDKIVWSFRLLIISFYSAIYPKSAALFRSDQKDWQRFKRKVNTLLFIAFISCGIALYLFPDTVVLLITGTHDELASVYIKAICLVPMVAALNALNVIDLLLSDKYHYIFVIGLILLAVSIAVSGIFLFINNSRLFGYYPIIVESFSLPLYLYFIRRANTIEGTKR